MLPLLVWLAGIAFGLWTIWHWGFTREAMAFADCASVFLWMVGGAAWIGRKLQAGAAARTVDGARGPTGPPLVLTDKDREALKKAVAQHQSNSPSL